MPALDRVPRLAVLALVALLLAPCDGSLAVTLSGHVADAGSNAPIAGATITALIPGFPFPVASYTTQTDVSGDYQADVVAGDYFINAEAPGYLRSPTTDLTIDSMPAVADFVLLMPASISGTVRAAVGGSGLGQKTVVLVPLDVTLLYHDAFTADDGSYVIDDIVPGPYYACVADPQDVWLDQCFDGMNVPASGVEAYSTLNLSSGEARSAIDFNLSTGSTIAGNVVDSVDSAPIANAPINLTLYSDNKAVVSHIDAATDANDVYSIAGVAPGSYYLGVGARFVYGHPNSFYTGTFHATEPCAAASCTLAEAAPINVGVESTTLGVDVAMHPGHIVTGKVTIAGTDTGIPGVTVETCEFGGNLFDITATAVTGPDGTYSLAHVLGSGAHVDTANSLGFVDLAWPATPIYLSTHCDTIDGTALSFAAADESQSGVDFSLAPGAVILGRITATEFPGSGIDAVVAVWKNNGASLDLSWLGRADASGHYKTHGLQSGTYYVLAYYNYNYCQSWSDQPCLLGGPVPGIDLEFATSIDLTDLQVRDNIDIQLPVLILRNGFD